MLDLPGAITVMKPATVQLTRGSNDQAGTGVFVTAEGHVMTCYHVSETGPLSIRIDDEALPLELVASDVPQDLALLRPPNRLEGVAHVSLDPGPPREGEAVALTGFPSELRFLVTSHGTIAAGLQDRVGPPLRCFLVDLAVNFGNSGGPLYRVADARVLGLCAGYQPAGLLPRGDPRPPTNSGLAWITPSYAMVRLLERADLQPEAPQDAP